jgi:hypothetical protein
MPYSSFDDAAGSVFLLSLDLVPFSTTTAAASLNTLRPPKASPGEKEAFGDLMFANAFTLALTVTSDRLPFMLRLPFL